MHAHEQKLTGPGAQSHKHTQTKLGVSRQDVASNIYRPYFRCLLSPQITQNTVAKDLGVLSNVYTDLIPESTFTRKSLHFQQKQMLACS